jgi:hypothetical protein
MRDSSIETMYTQEKASPLALSTLTIQSDNKIANFIHPTEKFLFKLIRNCVLYVCVCVCVEVSKWIFAHGYVAAT